MIELNRCSSCGYLHIGPAPETCPVCGAPQSMFAAFQTLPDLVGTKTLEHLRDAFEGESQANRRYTLWRRIAELEGAPQSTLDAFDRAAAEETAHALGQLAYMEGFGTTAENLRSAAEGEGYETSEMYPRFAEDAEAEGFDEIAQYFRRLGGFEGAHRAAFQAALEEHERS